MYIVAAIIIGLAILAFLFWYLFVQKIPLQDGCLCDSETRMVLDMNYDCPLHGHWR